MIRSLLLASLLATLMANVAQAEGLLWKAVNPTPAQVVPAYGGISSPFPEIVPPPAEEDVSSTEIEDEQIRLREEAFSYAEQIVNSGRGLQPDLRMVSVGGTLVGNLGPRVLINNQWVGRGQQLRVRQIRTGEAIRALKSLSDYDQSGAERLLGKLNSTLSESPYAALTVTRITSSSVVLEGSHGASMLAIPQNR